MIYQSEAKDDTLEDPADGVYNNGDVPNDDEDSMDDGAGSMDDNSAAAKLDKRIRRKENCKKYYNSHPEVLRAKARERAARTKLNRIKETPDQREARLGRQRESSAKYRAANRLEVNYKQWKRNPRNVAWLQENLNWYKTSEGLEWCRLQKGIKSYEDWYEAHRPRDDRAA